MFLTKKLLASLILPPAGPLLLAALLLLLHVWRIRRLQHWHDVSRRLKMPGRTLPLLALLLLFGQLALCLPVVGQALLRDLETLPPVAPAQLRDIDAIVVLGGGLYHDAPEYGGDTIAGATLERLRYGARLARDSFKPVLLTGGAPWGGMPEAEAMKRSLALDFGIEARWVEAQSVDTAQNARFAAALLHKDGLRRIALVSHAWHLPRALPLFAAEGLEVVPAPTAYTTPTPDALADWLPSTRGMRMSQTALHEILGRWVDEAKGKQP